MYRSPIDIIYSDIQMKLESEVCKAVQNVGINVDKDELIKALSYDRQQYEKGYADAKAESEIIRCKDCKYQDENWRRVSVRWLPCMDMRTGSNWYCADAERRTDE